MQRRAQESAGKADETHAARVGAAKARLDEAGRALRDEQRIVLELPGTAVPAGRTVFLGEGLRVRRGGPVHAETTSTWPSGAPSGSRSPGPTARASPRCCGPQGELEPAGGQARLADGRVAYLSQRLDLLDLDRTVAENLRAYAPTMPEPDRMNLLARFLFRGSQAHLPVGVLSGGERLRATLACVLFAEPAPQLLLLDEPTNNLDLVSVGQLESALSAYEGAFVVVSHDERFLTEIKVDRRLHLAEGRLRE